MPLLAAGWSLGANILCRYLGEEGEACPIDAAVAMCNPFNLVRHCFCWRARGGGVCVFGGGGGLKIK